MDNLIIIISLTIVLIIIYKVFKYNFELQDKQDIILKGYEQQQFDIENKERLIKVLESENKRLLEENQIGHDYTNNILREIIIEKNKKIDNLEHKRNIRNNDIEDNYRKMLLEKFNELREYYEDEYSKKDLGTAERVRFVGIVYGIYEAISLIEQNLWKEKD